MHTIMNQIITEKDLLRQIALLEELLNRPKLTARELAEKVGTTERTVFSDLQLIRGLLPDGWHLETDSSGIRLTASEDTLTNQLWEVFLQQSIGVSLLKELLFTKALSTRQFIQKAGISLETLKRHAGKVNRQLKTYQIRIKVSASSCTLLGEETAIRIFYHRLLLPFTQNNFFFDGYAIHEVNYLQFIDKISTTDLFVETEEVFGTCWFFINAIRIKAGCTISHFSYKEEDVLFQLYHAPLSALYQTEGVYLQGEEDFFAFFCFLESWNYSNRYGRMISQALAQNFSALQGPCLLFVDQLADFLKIKTLRQTKLADNLLLLFLKYMESPELSAQFQLEYQEMVRLRKRNRQEMYQRALELISQITGQDEDGQLDYLVNLISLLCQQARALAQPEIMKAYFVFQGEPAWKAFLQQELQDYLGTRVRLIPIELSELADIRFGDQDILLSNMPLGKVEASVVYISMIPTKNELSQLTKLTMPYFF